MRIDQLLPRIEQGQGLIMLATNALQIIDAAFVRCVRCVVKFPFPAAKQRRAIWQNVLPPAAAPSADDLDRLQALELTGGGIRNAVLHAAAPAAERATAVGMSVILEAAGCEGRVEPRAGLT